MRARCSSNVSEKLIKKKRKKVKNGIVTWQRKAREKSIAETTELYIIVLLLLLRTWRFQQRSTTSFTF